MDSFKTFFKTKKNYNALIEIYIIKGFRRTILHPTYYPRLFITPLYDESVVWTKKMSFKGKIFWQNRG
jgi:hypothetical protein